MGFNTSPTGYEKTALSDLQGAWGNLRSAVIDNFGFPDSEKLLFHIDEAMDRESVRNPQKMESTLLLIQNIAVQTVSPENVMEWLSEVRESYNEVLIAIADGSAE